jgi:hypothetical protein
MTTSTKAAPYFSLNRRIALGIVLLTSAILVVLAIAIGVLTYLNEVERQPLYFQSIASQADAEIEGFISYQQNQLDTLALTSLGNLENIAHLLPSITQAQNSAWLELAVFNADGAVVGAFAKDETILANLFTAKQSTWFANSLSGQEYLSNLYLSPQRRPYVIMATPVFSPEQEVIGVITGRLDMSNIWTIISNLEVGQTGSVYLADQNNMLIAYPNISLVLESTNLMNTGLEAVLSAPDGELVDATDLEGEVVTASSRKIGDTGWRLIVTLPWLEYYGNVSQTLLLVGIIGLGAIGVSIMASLYIGRRLTQPLRSLAETAQVLGAGDLSVRMLPHAMRLAWWVRLLTTWRPS